MLANATSHMRKSLKFVTIICLAAVLSGGNAMAQRPAFKALVVLSKAKDHIRMMTCAQPFLEKIAAENNFQVEISDDTSRINAANLKQYKVFVMLQLAPFDMSASQQ